MYRSDCPIDNALSPPNQEDWVPSKRRVKTKDGIEMAYVEWGRAAGMPVVLIHGFTDSSRAWSLIAPYLEDRRYIAVDLRGHGDSQKTRDGLNLFDFANDVCGLLDELGIQKADLVGHSLGSMTAAVMAIYHPQKVNRLILISSAAQAPLAIADWLRDTIESTPFPLDVDGKFLQEWTWNPHPVDPVFLKYLKQETASTPYETWKAGAVTLELSNWAMVARRITSPTFIMWGDQDQLFGAAEQEAVRAVLPQAKFKIYEGYGHSVTWEIPEVAASDILAFLSDDV